MKKLIFATGNEGKMKEIRMILGDLDYEILSMKEAVLQADIDENATTFEENALLKASAACRETGYPAFADDSGLCVDALGGAPGIYSARYAGEHGNDEANNKKLLENRKGIENRHAAFVCSIACVFPDGSEPIIAEGKVEGEILEAPRGESGFGYDPLFEYETGKTFAEMTADEKNKVSHRARAIEKFAKALTERLAQ